MTEQTVERTSLADRLRDAARAHITKQVLTLPIGRGDLGVRYSTAGISYEEYVDLRERLQESGPGQLPAALDLVIAAAEYVVADDDGWLPLQNALQTPAALLPGYGETLVALEVDAAQVLDRHVPDVEPGSARYNALALFTVYGVSTILGAEVESHAIDLMMFARGRMEGDRLPPSRAQDQ